MDMDMQHGFPAWTWTVDMHGCRNADKKLSPDRQFSVSLQCLVRHRHFGIMVSPAPLVTD
jgi:hypothetical protein